MKTHQIICCILWMAIWAAAIVIPDNRHYSASAGFRLLFLALYTSGAAWLARAG